FIRSHNKDEPNRGPSSSSSVVGGRESDRYAMAPRGSTHRCSGAARAVDAKTARDGQRRTTTALGRRRGAAATAGYRVRIAEGAASRQTLRHVVERRPVQIEIALHVAHHLDSVDVELLVVRACLVVELERVGQARAATTLHAHTKVDVLEVLGPHQLFHLL